MVQLLQGPSVLRDSTAATKPRWGQELTSAVVLGFATVNFSSNRGPYELLEVQLVLEFRRRIVHGACIPPEVGRESNCFLPQRRLEFIGRVDDGRHSPGSKSGRWERRRLNNDWGQLLRRIGRQHLSHNGQRCVSSARVRPNQGRRRRFYGAEPFLGLVRGEFRRRSYFTPCRYERRNFPGRARLCGGTIASWRRGTNSVVRHEWPPLPSQRVVHGIRPQFPAARMPPFPPTQVPSGPPGRRCQREDVHTISVRP